MNEATDTNLARDDDVRSQPELPAADGAPAGAAPPMVQFKAMLDLRMSLFWGNILLVVPLVLYPVIYLIIFFASGASAYPPAPHVIPTPWNFRWFMPRIPSYVGGGSTPDPAASNAMLAAVNASVQAIRVANEGKDSVAMIPSLWHRANTLDELKGLLADLTGSNPLRDEFRPDATPPIGGFMLHSIPTAQQPSKRFNVSLVVDPTPYKWAWGVPVAMLNSIHNGVQDVLPPIRNRNVSAEANLVVSDARRAALDRVFALYQNATAAGRKVVPPWSMELEGEQHAYRLTGTERAEYISSITVPLLLFSLYSLLMSVAYDLTAERVEGQFSYLVTNSLTPYIYFFAAMAGYLQIIMGVMVVLVLWYTRLHWISPLPTIVMMTLFCGIVVTEAGVFSFAFKSKNSVPGVLFLFTVLGSVGPTLLRASEFAPSPTVDWILSCIFPTYAMTVTFGEMMTAARKVQPFFMFYSTFPATAGIMIVHIAAALALIAYLAHRASLNMLGVNAQSSSLSRMFSRSAAYSSPGGKNDVEAGSEANTPVSSKIPRDPLLAVEKERIRSGTDRDKDVIRIEGLGMDFAVRGGGRRQVIQDLWFTVRQNEAFAFLGPNGAGKSTTVNILTGMLNQTKGTATICGKPPGHPDVQRLLGVLPQYDTLFPRLSVHKHLRAFAIIKGVPLEKVDAVIKQAAADATLDKFMYRKVEELSGGTKRRMSIAIACLGRPAVVILDEPTIGVDVCTRRAIWDMVACLKKSTSILLVTHDMDEAERLCERAGIMINGSLVCLGAPQRLKALFGATYLLKLQFSDPALIDTALADLESNIARMGGNARASQQSETHLELCIEMGASTPVAASSASSATAVTEGAVSRTALEVEVQGHAPFLASMLRFVSGKRAEFGITDWSLGEVSLGELFVQLAPHHRMYQEEEAVV